MILGGSSDGIDITLTSGAYNIVYKEMDPDNVFVKMGQQGKAGRPDCYAQPPNAIQSMPKTFIIRPIGNLPRLRQSAIGFAR
jgi:hypothetical protein